MSRRHRRQKKNIYDIVLYPSDILHKHTKMLTKFSVADDLEDFLYESLLRSGGLAVAANQIGLNVKAFVMKVNDNKIFAINPVIKDYSLDSCVMPEGCLSIPGVVWRVRRRSEILIEAYDKNGDVFEYEASGLEARVIQHEMDHLDGIVLPDYLDDVMFDVFIEAYYSNLKKAASLIEIDEELDARLEI